MVTSQAIGDAFTTGNGEAQPRGHAVIDSGATETVGSLPAIEDLMRVRFEISGTPDSFKISQTPPRRFRFGSGSVGFSLSHVLIPQDLGESRVDLGVYSLDVEKVPILVGIRTLRALKTVLDCHQDTAVFAALDATVGVKLKRSASGHLLLDLSRNWLQDSFSLLNPTADVMAVASEPPETCEKEGVVFVLEHEPCNFQPEVGHQLHDTPSSSSPLPAVLFHSRGEAVLPSRLEVEAPVDSPCDRFWVIRALLASHGASFDGASGASSRRLEGEVDRAGQSRDGDHEDDGLEEQEQGERTAPRASSPN